MGYGQRWGYSWGNRSLAFLLEDIVVTPKASLLSASARPSRSCRDVAVGQKVTIERLSVLQPVLLGHIRSKPSASAVSIINTATENL